MFPIKPELDMGLCEICNENHQTIFELKEKGDTANSWEHIIFRYESHWYWNGLAEHNTWLQYDICKKCFFTKVLPALYEVGLPKKQMNGCRA